MTVEKVSYAGSPERVTEEIFDCVWVALADRKQPSPITSQVIQWVDWRLQGQISRFLLSRPSSSATTFVPTLKRLGSPLIAMQEPGEINWKNFSQNCQGMGMKNVLILCEEPDAVGALEKEVRRQSEAGLEKVTLGSDGAVGRG